MPIPMDQSEVLKNYTAAFASVLTALAIVVGAVWAYRKSIWSVERYPHIETFAEIKVIGEHEDKWIIELVAAIQNKGAAQHKMQKFKFDLRGLKAKDQLMASQEIGGQTKFPHLVKKGTFLPARLNFFFIDPGVISKYSYVTTAPTSMTFLIFHFWFSYGDKRGYSHAGECTIKLPSPAAKEAPESLSLAI